jgi:hypothetical protein
MVKSFFFGLYLVTVLVIVNCGPAIMRGTLVNKIHEPEESWVQMMPVVTDKTTTMIPIVHNDDEDWLFIIEDTSKSSAEIRQRKIYVSQDVFDQHKEGDWIEVTDLGEIRDKDKPAKSRKKEDPLP